MNPPLAQLFEAQAGVATTGQILGHLGRHAFDRAVDTGVLERIWQGIYCLVNRPTRCG